MVSNEFVYLFSWCCQNLIIYVCRCIILIIKTENHKIDEIGYAEYNVKLVNKNNSIKFIFTIHQLWHVKSKFYLTTIFGFIGDLGKRKHAHIHTHTHTHMLTYACLHITSIQFVSHYLKFIIIWKDVSNKFICCVFEHYKSITR